VSADGDPLLSRAGLSSEQLVEVLGLIAGTDIVDLDITVGSTRLSLKRPALSPAVAASDHTEAAQEPPPSLAIASPLVGIFRPSVSAGDAVLPGQSIGAIEALGMPTSVDAPQSGTVEDLLVQDGSAVEYGQPLLILRRSNNVG
jgi:acetyl-CoA carboxylase biotin carboxyl carrier protein